MTEEEFNQFLKNFKKFIEKMTGIILKFDIANAKFVS